MHGFRKVKLVTVRVGFTDWPAQCNTTELIYKQQQVILNIRDIK